MAGDAQPLKQFRRLNGKPMLAWSVEAMLRCDKVGAVIVVTPPDDGGRCAALLPTDPRLRFVEGGDVRSQSVRNGLGALSASGGSWTKLLIHDAARPGLSLDVIDELIAALDEADAAAPALPMTDAVKSQGEDGAVRTVARDTLVRVQTPQAMRFPLALDVYAHAAQSAVDDLALLEGTRARIAFTQGRPELMKVTHKEDVAVMEKLLAAPAAAMRIGNGFDVHGFEPGDTVTLCGVKIPHTKKLEGHSDADAGWHALTDAILGAAALGDIGDHFPPSDPRWKGQDSRTFLVHAVKLAAERGFRVVNADVTLLCEKPKIAPHREAMRQRTAEALGVDLSCVSVKATTTEKLGFLGREEGIAAQAVVLLTSG